MTYLLNCLDFAEMLKLFYESKDLFDLVNLLESVKDKYSLGSSVGIRGTMVLRWTVGQQI